MAALQSSGTISILDLRNHFGDTGDSGLSEFYRGGGRVPSQRIIRDPSSGDYYSPTFNTIGEPNGGTVYCDGGIGMYWNSTYLGNATSITSGGSTYYAGSFREQISVDYGGEGSFIINYNLYGVYRTYPVEINTGIPTSGQISLEQFYGAENS